MKLKLIDLLIYLLLFIFVVAFPVELFELAFIYELIIKIGLRLILLAFYICIILKSKVNIFEHGPVKEALLFVPFFLICFNNMFASLFGGGFNPSNNIGLFMLELLLCIISVILEEIVFRFFIQNSLVCKTHFIRIVLSALIFALCHLIYIVNVRNVDALLDLLLKTLYTFGLGLVIGFIYEYTHSFVFAFLIHFMFNLFNDVLYGFLGGYTSNLAFILTSVVVALLAASYGVTLYLVKYKRMDVPE